MGTQLFCETFLLRALIQIGDVPELLTLFRQCRNQIRMRVAQGVHCNASRKIEILGSICREQSHTFAALEVNRRSGKCTKE